MTDSAGLRGSDETSLFSTEEDVDLPDILNNTNIIESQPLSGSLPRLKKKEGKELFFAVMFVNFSI